MRTQMKEERMEKEHAAGGKYVQPEDVRIPSVIKEW